MLEIFYSLFVLNRKYQIVNNAFILQIWIAYQENEGLIMNRTNKFSKLYTKEPNDHYINYLF
jgi:hypothetical protein